MGRACNTNGSLEDCMYDIGEEIRRNVTVRKTKT
jgi:hypothetical protein